MAGPLSESRTAIPTLVVALGLAASWFTWSVVSAAEDSADRQRFEEQADRLASQVEHLGSHEAQVLRLLQSQLTAPQGGDGCARAFTRGAVEKTWRSPQNMGYDAGSFHLQGELPDR